MSVKKKIPLRQCIGCGEMKSKKEMMRILKTKVADKAAADTENPVLTEEIILDATGRKNGRGAYLCPRMDCFEKAVKSKGIERSLKMPVPKEVYDKLREEMEQVGS